MIDLGNRPTLPVLEKRNHCVCMKHGIYICEEGCPQCKAGEPATMQLPVIPNSSMSCYCTECGKVYWCKDGHSC